LPALAKLAKRDAGDRWMRLAMQSSLTDGAGQLLASLLCDETIRQSADHQPLLHDLALQVGRQGSEPEVLAVLSQLDALGDSTSGCGTACLLYLARGLSADRLTAIAREKKLIHVQRRIATATQMAQSTVADESAPIDDRVDALGMLDLAPTIDSQLLIELLAPRQPPPVQRAAVKALARVGDASIVGPLLAAWPALAPSLRSSVVELLFARPDRLPLVLDAVEDGRLSAGDLEASRVKFLRTHANAAIRSRAEKLFAQPAASRRSDVIEAYRGALTVSGDPGSGRKLFEKTCSGCHRVDGVGYELGPNLATIQNRGAETILVNVLDPNREVNPQYLNYLLATTDGRLLTGMLASETATSITLVRAENQRDTVLRADIDSLESSGMSLMPEGLEKDLSPQAMADLIAYLMAVR
jgi:putative heme-binding domain-containing protein